MHYMQQKEMDSAMDIEPFTWRDLSLFNKRCQKEITHIFALGTPISLSIGTQFCQLFINQVVVGHLGTDYLAATSLGGVVMSISMSYIFAFCSSINILCSQAVGAKNNALVSEWYQLGCVLTLLLSIPSCIIYLFTDSILLYLGATTHIAHLAGTYAKWSILCIIPQTQFNTAEFYFEAQRNVIPVVVVCTLMIPFNIAINVILVHGTLVNFIIPSWNGLGFIGSPIANAIGFTVQYLAYIAYMFAWKKYHLKTWSPLKWKTFSWKRTRKFMAVAIPQTISQALEDWQIQVITLFTLRLDEVSIAAFATLNTIFIICHCFAIGLCEAIGVLVGDALGANRPVYAKYISWVSILIAALSGLITGALMAAFVPYLSRAFNASHEMHEIYQKVVWILAVSFFMLNMLTTICGVLQGQARTVGMTVVALVACWGCSVPLSWYLGIYRDDGDEGIYIALVIGYSIFFCGDVILFFMSDWEQCALEAVTRSKHEDPSIASKDALLINQNQ